MVCQKHLVGKKHLINMKVDVNFSRDDVGCVELL